MAINSRHPRLFLILSFFIFILYFFFFNLSSYAQRAGYFIDTEGGERRFVQRLAWSGGEFALRYEAVIESERDGSYVNYHREFTTALYIDISLQPGNYRFRVIPYDILNRQGSASEWKYIEVLPALQPEFLAVVSENITDGAGESNSFLFNIIGYNIDWDAEIFIRSADGTVELACTEITDEKYDSVRGGVIRAYIESEKLIPGKYDLVIRNPGGLEARLNVLLPEQKLAVEPEPEPEPEPIVEPEKIVEAEPEIETHIEEETPEREKKQGLEPLKPFIFSVGLAFIPSFPIYGDFIDGGMSLFGLTLRANALFHLPIGIYIGPELSVLAYPGNYPDVNGNYSDYSGFENFSDRLTLMAGVNLLARKWFPGEKAALSFRAGADYGFLPSSIEQLNVRIDVSFLWRFTNNLLLEVGFDYSHIFTEELSGAFLRPWLGLSFQFN